MSSLAVWKRLIVDLALLKIDPSLPLERKKYIVQDSGASLVFVSREENLVEALNFEPAHTNLVMSDSEMSNGTLSSDTNNPVGHHVRAVILSDDIDLDIVLSNSVQPQNRIVTLNELGDGDCTEAHEIGEAGLDDAAYLLYTAGLHFSMVLT